MIKEIPVLGSWGGNGSPSQSCLVGLRGCPTTKGLKTALLPFGCSSEEFWTMGKKPDPVMILSGRKGVKMP